MEKNIEVVEACGRAIEDLPVEIVERKGIGHPDTLCDGIAERISVDYTRWCDEHIQHRLHHNFDKVQLVAGEATLDFGEGRIDQPIRIQIAGRAISKIDDTEVPVKDLAIQAARTHLDGAVRGLDPDRHVVFECHAGRGDPSLIDTAQGDRIKANDTSFGCSHWPLSGLERTVLETCNHINRGLIERFPIGEDIKVMGLRRKGRIVLTCAVPFLALETKNRTQYDDLKGQLGEEILTFARRVDSRTEKVALNCADADRGKNVFLTLTGTGAEAADDGSVGRGNRVNGLITPFRSASLEAACGKNPISHVGKIYNVLSLQVAESIVTEVDEVEEATVYVLSQIGAPLANPLVASATVRTRSGNLSSAVDEGVRAVVDRHLDGVDGLTDLILSGRMSLY